MATSRGGASAQEPSSPKTACASAVAPSAMARSKRKMSASTHVQSSGTACAARRSSSETASRPILARRSERASAVFASRATSSRRARASAPRPRRSRASARTTARSLAEGPAFGPMPIARSTSASAALASGGRCSSRPRARMRSWPAVRSSPGSPGDLPPWRPSSAFGMSTASAAIPRTTTTPRIGMSRDLGGAFRRARRAAIVASSSSTSSGIVWPRNSSSASAMAVALGKRSSGRVAMARSMIAARPRGKRGAAFESGVSSPMATRESTSICCPRTTGVSPEAAVKRTAPSP